MSQMTEAQYRARFGGIAQKDVNSIELADAWIKSARMKKEHLSPSVEGDLYLAIEMIGQYLLDAIKEGQYHEPRSNGDSKN